MLGADVTSTVMKIKQQLRKMEQVWGWVGRCNSPEKSCRASSSICSHTTQLLVRHLHGWCEESQTIQAFCIELV